MSHKQTFLSKELKGIQNNSQLVNQNKLKEDIHLLISQRYAVALRNYLSTNQIQFQQLKANIESSGSNFQDQRQEDLKICFKIPSLENIRVKQNAYKFYYLLLKRLYQLRKVLINPEQQQFTFQNFISIYKQSLQQKLSIFNLIPNKSYAKLGTIVGSSSLNNIFIKNQFHILKQQLGLFINSHKPLIQSLQKQADTVNQQYVELIEKFTQKNANLHVHNLQLLVEEKERQKKKTNQGIYGKSKINSMKSNITKQNQKIIQNSKNDKKSYFRASLKSKQDPRKQQFERIKLIIKNNMWGFNQRIKQKLVQLKKLKQQSKQN